MIKMINFAGREFLPAILLSTIVLIVSSAMQMLLPYGIKTMIDIASGIELSWSISFVAGLLLFVYLLKVVIGLAGQLLLQMTGDKIVAKTNVQVFNHFQKLPLSFFNDTSIGELMSRCNNDISAIRNILTSVLTSSIISVIQFIGAITVMAYMNWKLALVVLVLAPLSALITGAFSNTFYQISKRVQDTIAKSNATLQETLHSIETIKLFSRESHQNALYQKDINKFLDAAKEARHKDAAFSSVIAYITSISSVIVVWFAATLITHGEVTAGTLVAFLMYSQFLTQSIDGLSSGYNSYIRAKGSTERVFEILDLDTEQHTPVAPVTSSKPVGIRVTDLTFTYETGDTIIDSLNFDISPGSTFAISGQSGAGKSTVVKLLSGLLKPDKGDIQFSGLPSNNLSLSEQRGLFSFVPQEIQLLAGSIKDNIKFAKLDASDEQIEQVCRLSGAYQFISDFPEGFDTKVGRAGATLSGGQKQRIAIARALLCDAPILVLDEATSALDTNNEQYIFDLIGKLKGHKTIILISHNEEMKTIADQILELPDAIKHSSSGLAKIA